MAENTGQPTLHTASLATNSDDMGENDVDIYMSDGSSSFEEDVSDIESGTQPYLFEPEADELDEMQDSPQAANDHAERRGNTDWCNCDNCSVMATIDESVCCQEIAKIFSKLDEFPHLTCITEHPGFQTVCLDRYVLETAYYVYRQTQQQDLEESNQRYRYVAYRQLVRWCWGWLGKKIRVPLPSCAVSHIRQTFPSDNGERYRYVAYRQLVRWCWGWLGKKIRVPLPSCAVSHIRQTFPSDNGEYVGFNPV